MVSRPFQPRERVIVDSSALAALAGRPHARSDQSVRTLRTTPPDSDPFRKDRLRAQLPKTKSSSDPSQNSSSHRLGWYRSPTTARSRVSHAIIGEDVHLAGDSGSRHFLGVGSYGPPTRCPSVYPDFYIRRARSTGHMPRDLAQSFDRIYRSYTVHPTRVSRSKSADFKVDSVWYISSPTGGTINIRPAVRSKMVNLVRSGTDVSNNDRPSTLQGIATSNTSAIVGTNVHDLGRCDR